MKAAYVLKPGPAESIVYGDMPKPTVGPNDVLVRMGAVALNPIDTYIRAGMVKMDLPSPFITGSDIAGVVEEVGENVSHFRKGDRVWGSNQGQFGRQGTFAEYSSINERYLYPMPHNARFEDMAAVALVAITAHLGIVRDIRLQPGETLFVNGGSGGVGSMVVQMAKTLGATVITTAGSPEKVAFCESIGADHALNYKTEDVPKRIAEIAPKGVNVWWETLREPNFDVAVGLLAPRGKMIVMAGRDARPPFPVGPFYVKGCTLQGFAIFNATTEEQRHAADDINRWVAEGKVKPGIDRIIPLSQAAEAHHIQEQATIHKAAELRGKIVLKPE